MCLKLNSVCAMGGFTNSNASGSHVGNWQSEKAWEYAIWKARAVANCKRAFLSERTHAVFKETAVKQNVSMNHIALYICFSVTSYYELSEVLDLQCLETCFKQEHHSLANRLGTCL